MKHSDPNRAACEGQAPRFESVYAEEHRIAATYCLGDATRPACPILEACRALTPGREGWHDGTWAGDLYSNGVKIREAGKAIKHTTRGKKSAA